MVRVQVGTRAAYCSIVLPVMPQLLVQHLYGTYIMCVFLEWLWYSRSFNRLLRSLVLKSQTVLNLSRAARTKYAEHLVQHFRLFRLAIIFDK